MWPQWCTGLPCKHPDYMAAVVTKRFGFGNGGDSAGDPDAALGAMVRTVVEEAVACWRQ